MGLVNVVLNYYSLFSLSEYHNNEYQSVRDCLNALNEKDAPIELRTLLTVIKKFENEGILLRIGQKGTDPIYDATYIAQNLRPRYMDYGSYQFYYDGFVSIRRHFAPAVLPVEVRKPNGDYDIGTCFVIGANRALTAKHCIENMENVKILDSHGQPVRPSSIYIPADEGDIALIELDYYNFNGPYFEIEYGNVLDEILTMGYPPIPGFDAVPVAEVTHVGSSIKVSKGRIVGEGATYRTGEDFYLINARVKGGNSGSPIINELGYVIGMLVNIPLDKDDRTKLDHLAYGVAVTGLNLSRFLHNIRRGNQIVNLPFSHTADGFSTTSN